MFEKISSNLKFFLSSLFLSLPIFWGMNIFQKNLEDFLFESQMAINPQIFTAQIATQNEVLFQKPIRDWRIDNLKIEAKSAISVFISGGTLNISDGVPSAIDSQKNQHILFENGENEKLPIASVTKLMTADIVWENYDLSQVIEISSQAVKVEGNSGDFKIGEILTVRELIYSLLIESSNDAAVALTELIGEGAFVDLMNFQAKDLKMDNTYFFNSTGLEPDKPDGPINPVRNNISNGVNYSTARDLVELVVYLLKNNPKILEISALPEYDLYTSDNVFHHKLLNTDELLKEIPDAVGSKTGWTPQAQGCLILVMKAPDNKGVIINVVLGSANRFEEMKKLINWISEAYQW